MWFYISLAFIYLVYFFYKRHFEYWKRRNVPSLSLGYLLRSSFDVLLYKKSFGEVMTDIYRKYEGYPCVGITISSTPALLVRDPDLIKHIVSTDFNSFYDNGSTIDKTVDPIIGRNPFFLRGEEWKSTRSQLTPGFTPGKMKLVFPLVEQVAKNLVKYLEKNPKHMEAKDVCTRYTTDSVATAAFGLDGKSFDADISDFRQIAAGFLGTQGSTATIMATLAFMVPSLFSIFNFKIVPKHIEDKLVDIVSTTMKYRKENNVSRKDFLQFILQLKESIANFTDIDATGHAASFFADGYETSSIVIMHIVYELAAHPECQQRLRDEINEYLDSNDGKFTFEGVQDMKYLDACVYESLRKNTVLPVNTKLCTQQFTYTTESDDFKKLTVTIKPGMTIYLPIAALHTDPKYFENPSEYRPERMLNRNEFNKYVLQPFGVGRRMCLGLTFGMLQTKLAIVYVVKNFVVSVNDQTVLPRSPNPWYFLNTTKHPIYLDFKKI